MVVTTVVTKISIGVGDDEVGGDEDGDDVDGDAGVGGYGEDLQRE